MIVVGDVVGERGDLRLEAGPGAERQIHLGIGLGQRPGRRGDRAIMLGEAFQRLPAEVEPRPARIGRLDPGDDAQRVRVMIEAPRPGHRGVQRILAGMAERRMAEIVREGERLGEILVEAERARDRPRDLRDLQAVGQAHAKNDRRRAPRTPASCGADGGTRSSGRCDPGRAGRRRVGRG